MRQLSRRSSCARSLFETLNNSRNTLHKFPDDDNVTFARLHGMFHDWPREYERTRFVVAAPFADHSRYAIFFVDAHTVDDLPALADAAVVVDNHGTHSLVRVNQVLTRMSVTQARRTLRMLERHTRVLEMMKGNGTRIEAAE